MDYPHFADYQPIVDEARAALPKSYAHALPFFVTPPERSASGHTAPELAYRAMVDALDGITDAELRKLAPFVRRWKRLDGAGRATLDTCGTIIQEQAEREARARRRARGHEVLDFKQWRARVRLSKARGNRAAR